MEYLREEEWISGVRCICTSCSYSFMEYGACGRKGMDPWGERYTYCSYSCLEYEGWRRRKNGTLGWVE
jgi:hypothetical protein